MQQQQQQYQQHYQHQQQYQTPPAPPPPHMQGQQFHGLQHQQQQQVLRERFQVLSMQATKAEADVKVAVQQAQATAGTYTVTQTLESAEGIINSQQEPLMKMLEALMEAQRTFPPDLARPCVQLANRLRLQQNIILQEQQKIRKGRAEAERLEKERALEQQDQSQLDAILPEATEKANAAEDAAEKAVITSELVQAAGDDKEEAMRAVDQTENAVTEAGRLIGEARAYFNAKHAIVRQMGSEQVRIRAQAELTKLIGQLQEAQAKIKPLVGLRQTIQQKQQAQKIVAEVVEKLAPAKLECDRAEEVASAVADGGDSDEARETMDALVQKASSEIAAVMRLITAKKSQANALVIAELSKLEEQAKQASDRMGQLKAASKEFAEKAAWKGLVKEASAKVQAVQEAVSKAADAEGPFLLGVDELPLDETLTALRDCEASAATANTAASTTRMFIMTKLVDAKRLSPSLSQDFSAKLKQLQTQLEVHIKRLNDLKSKTAERKRVALLREAEVLVSNLEQLTKQLGEVAQPLLDTAQIEALPPVAAKRLKGEASKAEGKAAVALAKARTFVHERQVEARSRTGTSADAAGVLLKLSARVSAQQAEVTKWQRVTGTREELETKIRNAAEQAKAAEEKVGLARQAVDELVTQTVTAVEVKKADQALNAANLAMRNAVKAAEALATVDEEESTLLLSKLKERQELLDAAMATKKEKQGSFLAQSIVSEVDKQMADTEQLLQRAADLDAEHDEAAEAGQDPATLRSITQRLDEAARQATAGVSKTRSFIAMKRIAVKRLSPELAESATKDLDAVEGRLAKATEQVQVVNQHVVAKRKADSAAAAAAAAAVPAAAYAPEPPMKRGRMDYGAAAPPPPPPGMPTHQTASSATTSKASLPRPLPKAAGFLTPGKARGASPSHAQAAPSSELKLSQVYVMKPVQVDEVAPDVIRLSGCSLSVADNGEPFRVLELAPGSELTIQGVEVGDVLCTVDGQEARGVPLQMLMATLRNATCLQFGRGPPAPSGGLATSAKSAPLSRPSVPHRGGYHTDDSAAEAQAMDWEAEPSGQQAAWGQDYVGGGQRCGHEAQHEGFSRWGEQPEEAKRGVPSRRDDDRQGGWGEDARARSRDDRDGRGRSRDDRWADRREERQDDWRDRRWGDRRDDQRGDDRRDDRRRGGGSQWDDRRGDTREDRWVDPRDERQDAPRGSAWEARKPVPVPRRYPVDGQDKRPQRQSHWDEQQSQWEQQQQPNQQEQPQQWDEQQQSDQQSDQQSWEQQQWDQQQWEQQQWEQSQAPQEGAQADEDPQDAMQDGTQDEDWRDHEGASRGGFAPAVPKTSRTGSPPGRLPMPKSKSKSAPTPSPMPMPSSRGKASLPAPTIAKPKSASSSAGLLMPRAVPPKGAGLLPVGNPKSVGAPTVPKSGGSEVLGAPTVAKSKSSAQAPTVPKSSIFPRRTTAAASEPRRTDPADGKEYTFEEVQEKYANSYSTEEVQAYWDAEMWAPRQSFSSAPEQAQPQDVEDEGAPQGADYEEDAGERAAQKRPTPTAAPKSKSKAAPYGGIQPKAVYSSRQ
mmetsp:Transcript_95848/g.276816  ORF Transcript_95848/g.276816 Transcript_95848/m.276816 type:complete len:1557 (-) Transcript_95848:217-4887(-)